MEKLLYALCFLRAEMNHLFTAKLLVVSCIFVVRSLQFDSLPSRALIAFIAPRRISLIIFSLYHSLSELMMVQQV